MKILIVSQYFWPENFKINDIAIALKDKGHDIEILTGKPNYPTGKFFKGYSFLKKNSEIFNGIKIYRAPLIPRVNGNGLFLFLNYFSFAFFASFRVFFIKNKFDKILVFEPSPITVGIPAIIAKFRFKCPIYFWVQDLWPASITAAGGIKNKFILSFFDKLTKYIYYNCTKILVQSKAFIPYIVNQNIDSSKLVYLPNTTESYYKYQLPEITISNSLPAGFKIMFAGNIGEAQNFHTILHSALLLKIDGVKVNWIIIGSGREKINIEKKIEELELTEEFLFLGSFPSEEMPKYFSCSDVLLVSLKDDPIFALTIPSKIQSYMACGKPIIASLNGEAARIIEEANAGFTCQANNEIELANCIKKAVNLSRNELIKMGENARIYFELEFEREKLVSKLEKILI